MPGGAPKIDAEDAAVRSAAATAEPEPYGGEAGGLVRHPGNEELFQALSWSVAGLERGWPLHVHVEGLRGTGKTTIVRRFRDRLPLIRRIRDCIYQCDPSAPHCPDHRDLSPDEVARLGEEWVPAPFLEVSASAKLGTLVGSVDLVRVVDRERPDARILPGTLAQAHRGVVFVDEINRLADTAPELADALLDVMGTKPGRLQIEETGLPRVVLPISVTVWAASNPDEEPGPLADVRRQLADRFDLSVAMQRPASVEVVRRILFEAPRAVPGLAAPAARRLVPAGAIAIEREADVPVPGGRAGAATPEARAERSPVHSATSEAGARRAPDDAAPRERPAPPPWPELDEPHRDFLASAYIRFQLESLRAVEAWQAAARLAAACAGRERVAASDLLAAAAPALRHRVEMEALPEILAYARDRLLSDEADEAGEEKGEGVLTPAGMPAGRGIAEDGRGGSNRGTCDDSDDEDEEGARRAQVGRAARDGGSGSGPGLHPDDGVPPWTRLFRAWRRPAGGGHDAGDDGLDGGRMPVGHASAAPGLGGAGDPAGRGGRDGGSGNARGGPGNGRAGGGLGRGSAGAAGPRRGPGASLADPRESPVVAPPRPARHLADLGAAPLWHPERADE